MLPEQARGHCKNIREVLEELVELLDGGCWRVSTAKPGPGRVISRPISWREILLQPYRTDASLSRAEKHQPLDVPGAVVLFHLASNGKTKGMPS